MHLTELTPFVALVGSAICAPIDLSARATTPLGSLTLKSSRDSNTFFQVYAPQPGPMHTLAPGEQWTQQFQTTSGGGVAVKMGDSQESLASAPLQMEYTVNAAMSLVYYDMSVIDGKGGIGTDWKLAPSQVPDPSSNTCVTVDNNNDYKNHGEDDRATMSCHSTNSVTLTLY